MGAPYALSSDLVSAWPAKSLEVAQYIDGQLPLIAMTQNAQTGTTYSLAATDFTKLVTLSNASPVTVTVPLESSVAWVAGTQLRLMNLGAGVVTVAGAVGVTINGSPLTLAQYKNATLTKTGTNTWTFNGSSAAPGMDLITPTSIANVGGSATLTGGTVTFSAITTSVSLNGIFTSDYENYRVLITGTGTVNDAINARLRLAGTDNTTASSYVTNLLNVTTATVGGNRSVTTSWGFEGLDTTNMFSIAFDIMRPAVAAETGFVGIGNKSSRLGLRGGHHTQAVAYDGITLLPNSGNMTGTIRVYGYKGT